MPTAARIDVLLSILNATDVGTLDSVADKLRQVQEELRDLDRPELAERAGEAVAAIAHDHEVWQLAWDPREPNGLRGRQ